MIRFVSGLFKFAGIISQHQVEWNIGIGRIRVALNDSDPNEREKELVQMQHVEHNIDDRMPLMRDD